MDVTGNCGLCSVSAVSLSGLIDDCHHGHFVCLPYTPTELSIYQWAVVGIEV
jgi:hypothetical protein